MAKPKEKINFYFMGNIERGANYRWVRGYTVITEAGTQYPWMTKAECRSYAKQQGKTASFTEDKTLGK